MLAMLLLRANRVVAVDDLAEALWGSALPPSARVTVQNYVKRLRDALGDAGGRIVTQPPGYLIRVAAGELDVSLFEANLDSARTAAAAGSWETAAAEARAALLEWRGDPLADVPSQYLALREVPRLADLRLQAAEIGIEAALRLGRPAAVIGELRQLVSSDPFRERLAALLMAALYEDGRQAEALAVYQQTRDVLVGELGVEPGRDLRDLHQSILAGDKAMPALPGPPTMPAAPGAAGAPAPRAPRQLPAAVGCFTGRYAELAALTGLLDGGSRAAAATMVILAIGGTAGVGKTALAVHWAHRAAGRFPDGQLYVNLRGYDPGQPMPAADALAGFLRSLGVPGQDIPPETDQRAAHYRSLLSDKRMLVMLDNAGSAEQVRPLLPGTPACTVVVTSRDALAGLAARDGAARLDLDVLPQDDAAALLRALIGPRVDAEPDAVAELAVQCCRLPLALRVAAELAASRPAVPLAALVSELADLHTRLDLLAAGGDPHAEVRAVFSWSCHHLDPDIARTFRLLGLHPGPDVDSYAAAALTGTTVLRARGALDVLARAHLIQPAAPGRYGMHDLLRGYARELSATQDTREEQHAALTRLFDHYLHTAAAAMDILLPAERHRRPRIPRPVTPVPPLPDPAAAREWLDRERAALVVTAGHTAVHGWPGHATRLAATLARYLLNDCHFPDALTIFSHAVSAARRTSDRAAEATALNYIGLADQYQGRLQQAAEHHQQALALFRAVGNRSGEARTLGSIGIDETRLGRHEQAADHQQAAVAIYRDLGDRLGEARALGHLGWTRQRQGRYREATDCHKQSLGLSREIGDHHGEAWALARLGFIELRLHCYQRSAGYLEQSLALFHEMGDTSGESENLSRLSEAYAGLGRYEQAAGNLERALAMSREIGDPALEADALNGFGDVLFQTGEARKARTHHATALRLASQAGEPREEARAHSGLARACHADGDPVQARHHWQQALTRYTAIGAPEADQIRVRLTKGGDDGDDAHKPTEQG
jgi:DNA-binding SARP family transcriptional activator